MSNEIHYDYGDDYDYENYNYDSEHNNDESLQEDEEDIPMWCTVKTCACIKPATNLGCFIWSQKNNQ